jgi:hypothetical protein
MDYGLAGICPDGGVDMKNETAALEKAIRILEKAGFRVFDITLRVNPGVKLNASEALKKSYVASFSITPGEAPATTGASPGAVVDQL